MTNKYLGEEAVTLNGETLTLVYDWAALARMKSELANEALVAAMRGSDPLALATVISAGLEKKHGSIDPRQIMDWSPPLFPTIEAVNRAMNYAYWGPEGEPKATKENPRKRATS